MLYKCSSFEPLNSLKGTEPEVMAIFYLRRFSGHYFGLRERGRQIEMHYHTNSSYILFPILVSCIIYFIHNFGVSCRFQIKLLRKLLFHQMPLFFLFITVVKNTISQVIHFGEVSCFDEFCCIFISRVL